MFSKKFFEQSSSALQTSFQKIKRVNSLVYKTSAFLHVYRKVSENRVLAGRISKRWGGYAQEWLSNADTYAITFPLEMEANSTNY